MSDIARGITLSGNKIVGSPGEREPLDTDEVVTNEAGGRIQADNAFGIAVVGSYASGHTATIDNEAAATIKGGGATAAALDGARVRQRHHHRRWNYRRLQQRLGYQPWRR